MTIKNGFSYVLKKSSKAFIMSLFVSFFIWVLINLSKTYEKSVTIKLRYENVKKGVLLKTKDSVLKVKIQGSGFSFFNNNLNNIEYGVDTQNYKNQLNWAENNEQLKSLFPKSINILSVVPQKLNFKLISLSEKKVPIKSFIEVQTTKGYDIVKSIFSNDSILIYGENLHVNKINLIKTENLKFNNITSSINGNVALINESSDLLLEYDSLKYNFEVEPFTQGDFKLDLLIKNVPKNKEVNIFPQQVMLQFQAPLSIFSTIKKNDFSIYVDYNDVNESNLLPIYLDYFPEGVKNINILKKTVTNLVIEL